MVQKRPGKKIVKSIFIWAARAAFDFPLEKEQTCWRYLVHSCMFFKRAVQSFLISLNTLSIKGIPCCKKWSKKDLEKNCEIYIYMGSQDSILNIMSNHWIQFPFWMICFELTFIVNSKNKSEIKTDYPRRKLNSMMEHNI